MTNNSLPNILESIWNCSFFGQKNMCKKSIVKIQIILKKKTVENKNHCFRVSLACTRLYTTVLSVYNGASLTLVFHHCFLFTWHKELATWQSGSFTVSGFICKQTNTDNVHLQARLRLSTTFSISSWELASSLILGSSWQQSTASCFNDFFSLKGLIFDSDDFHK